MSKMQRPQFLHLLFFNGVEPSGGGATLLYKPYKDGSSSIFVALCAPTEHNFNRKKGRKIVLDRVDEADPNYTKCYKTTMTFKQFRERSEKFIQKKIKHLLTLPRREHWEDVFEDELLTMAEVKEIVSKKNTRRKTVSTV